MTFRFKTVELNNNTGISFYKEESRLYLLETINLIFITNLNSSCNIKEKPVSIKTCFHSNDETCIKLVLNILLDENGIAYI